MLWKNLRFVVIAICVTVVLSIFIKESYNHLCKHSFEVINQTTVTKPYGDSWWEKTGDGAFAKSVKKFKMREHTIYHLQCSTCGRMSEKEIH